MSEEKKSITEQVEDKAVDAVVGVKLDINDLVKQTRQTFGWAPSWFEKAAYAVCGASVGSIATASVMYFA